VPATPVLRDVLQRHGAWVDVALGALVAGLGVVSLWSVPAYVSYDFRDADALGVVLAVVAGGAVAVRSRWPLAAFALAAASSLATLQLGYSTGVGGLAPLLVLYTVAVRCPARVSAGATAALTLLLTLVLAFGPVEPTVTDWFVNVVVLLTAWSLGRSVRGRRAYTAGLEERNRALVAAREARLEAVTAAERARIAHEMQDLVAHGLTAMTVQASAARRVLRSDPDTAEQLLAHVEGAGHEVVQEVRRILSVLSTGDRDGPADRRPQPGVADLEDLVARARDEGLSVELATTGTPAELDPGVALTAYRLVQEALGNSRRHAGAAAVRVVLDWRPGLLTLAVEDDGRGVVAEAPDASPVGLWSLRERVQAYGGRLRAGPRTGGGFAVSATLPTVRTP
jgi:signal transduction histidine kinase